MHTHEAKLFLDYYLDDEVDAQFAVMLDGPWGSGKTHFIKQYLAQRLAGTVGDGKPRHLYASLYGITSTADITDQFFAQVHPRLTSKASRLLGTFATKALGVLGADVGTQEDRQALQQMLLKLDGKVLIFDDLERSSLPIGDVLGFINTFVEHEGLKVIVLANESDIPAEQQATYGRQKEKLIGKTIRVGSDPEEVLDKLIGLRKSKLVKDVIEAVRAKLLSTFLASGKPNYRNLRAILAEYERLVFAVDAQLCDKPEAMMQLLLYMVATGHEYRCGDLAEQTLALLPTTRHYVVKGMREVKTPAVLAFEVLQRRYPEVKWMDPLIAPAHLVLLYKSGDIDNVAINKALLEHPSIVGLAQVPAWRKLWNWTDLPRTDYLAAKAELLQQLSAHEVTHPGLILHSAGSILNLQSFGDSLLGEGVSVARYFESYLGTLVDSGTLVPDRSTFGFIARSFGGLVYSGKDTPEFKEVFDLVRGATLRVFEAKMKQVASTYVERLTNDVQAYASLYEFGVEKENYADVALLHDVDASEFGKLLIRDCLPNEDLFASLVRRYESERHHEFRLSAEYRWLAELRQDLDAQVSRAGAPHHQLLTLRVGYYFDQINESIARTA